MAGTGCCYFVGDFYDVTNFNQIADGSCIISINNNINTEYNDYGCSTMLAGQTVGSLNISGPASTEIYRGCPGRAGVQILWTRKYNCEADEVVFIFTGEGRSFMSGDAESYVSLNTTFDKTTKIISASSQSGPSSLFTNIEQIEGQGMTYRKGPIAFDTATETGCTMPNMGLGTGPYYLQNFNIELVPGAIPIANYTFSYNP